MRKRLYIILPLATIVWLLGVFPAPIAFSRPSVEEKAARRAAYWGLFADVYRARTCLSDAAGGEKCAEAALLDASKHVAKVDLAVGASSSSLAVELESISVLVRSQDLAAARSRLTLFREKLIEEFASNTAPVLQPSRVLGESLFSEYCGSCHGNGLGLPGKLTDQLRVQPTSFGRVERQSTQSPFGVYGVMIHGVDNSEMASMLDILSVDELWSVAFYVASLPYVGKPSDSAKAVPSTSDTGDFTQWFDVQAADFALSTLAVSTDDALVLRMNRLGKACGECQRELQFLRNEWPWSGKTGRLGDVAQSPRQKNEMRALVLLLCSVIFVSAGFYIVLRRSGRIE